MFGIAPSHVSRVSNLTEREQTGVERLSLELLRQQLQLFGDIATRQNGPLRDNIFRPGELTLAGVEVYRRPGRPRHTWADQIRRHAIKAAGIEERLKQLVAYCIDLKNWYSCTKDYACGDKL